MEILREPDVNNIRPEITRLIQDKLLKESGKVKCEHTKKSVRTSSVTDLEYFSRNKKPAAVAVLAQMELFSC